MSCVSVFITTVNATPACDVLNGEQLTAADSVLLPHAAEFWQLCVAIHEHLLP